MPVQDPRLTLVLAGLALTLAIPACSRRAADVPDAAEAGVADAFADVALADATQLSTAWSKRFGTASNEIGFSVDVDAKNNVVLAGSFDGQLDLGGAKLTSSGGVDVFVASFDPSGADRWSTSLGGPDNEKCRDLATDAAGNVFVVGDFKDTLALEGSSLTSAGDYDVFLVSFDPSGGQRWARRIGGAGPDSARAVAVGQGGEVVITGEFSDTVDLGGGASLTSAGKKDGFVASYSSDGAHLWSRRFGDVEDDRAHGVAADASGNLWVTGSFQGTVDLGGGSLASAGLEDIVVGRLSPQGAHLWSARFGGAYGDIGELVAADGQGNAYLTGGFHATVDFGGGAVTAPGSPLHPSQNEATFLTSYAPDGAHRWSYAAGVYVFHGLTARGPDDLYLATNDEGAGADDPSDVLVARYGNAGRTWSARVGGPGLEMCRDMAMDNVGNFYVTGQFEGTTDFGAGELTSAGQADVFLVKLSP